MDKLTCSKVLFTSVLVLLIFNTQLRIFTTQAAPMFTPFIYKMVIASSGDLLAVDKNGSIHARGDHRKGDHLCFAYHQPETNIVMLESTSGLGFVSLDSEGNVVLSSEEFSDEEFSDEELIGSGASASGLSVFHRRFKVTYTSAKSRHPQVQLEAEDLPGCTLAFDTNGVALNACEHAGTEGTKFRLLRSNC